MLKRGRSDSVLLAQTTVHEEGILPGLWESDNQLGQKNPADIDLSFLTPVKAKKTDLSSKPRSLSKKRRLISFSPAPNVHEFDKDSPSVRRLEIKRQETSELSDKLVFHELRHRGYDVSNVSNVSEDPAAHRKILNELFRRDYVYELERYGIKADGTLSELKQKCQLLKSMLQRCRVYTLCKNKRKQPIDMTKTELYNELLKKKCKLSKSLSRLKLEELVPALEAVLLKEDAGIRIPGYEFGKTLVSSSDLVEYKYVNSGVAGIDENQYEKESSELEKTMMKNFRSTFLVVLRNEIKRDHPKSVENDIALDTERVDSQDSFVGFLKSFITRKETDMQLNEINSLFNKLFMYKYNNNE